MGSSYGRASDLSGLSDTMSMITEDTAETDFFCCRVAGGESMG